MSKTYPFLKRDKRQNRSQRLSTFTLLFSLFSILFSIFQSGCVVADAEYTKLPPGPWRAALQIQAQYVTPNPKGKPLPEKLDMTYADVQPGEIPFNFEVIYDNDSTFHIDIINGTERITVPSEDIGFGRTKHRAVDTIFIDFPVYDSYVTGSFVGNTISGQWVVKNRENYSIPFIATQGKNYRFTSIRKEPKTDLTGKWACSFGLDGDAPWPAVGEFIQTGNELRGTFLTETGDYRFLEGTVQDDNFFLSCFDGAHAFLFEGKINEDGSLNGAFYSGKHYRTTWSGKKDESASLKSPDELTFLKEGFDGVSFSFANPDGKMISLDNPEYEGKAKIVQILGTWCPNCRDETEFLVDYLKRKQPQDLAVIALAFEKHKDREKANAAIRRYKDKFGMDYEMVLAGPSNKREAAEALPMLNHILSYPTMIFLDKNNQVKRIHTGFAGPATSHFDDFVKEFDSFVAELTAGDQI